MDPLAGAEAGDLLLLAAGDVGLVNRTLDRVRRFLAADLGVRLPSTVLEKSTRKQSQRAPEARWVLEVSAGWASPSSRGLWGSGRSP
jgi:hypothetical protein